MMKKLMVLTLTLVLIAAMAVTTANAQVHPVVGIQDVVSIPDAELEAVLREVLEVPDGAITVDKMNELTRLAASHGEIADLTGLEHAVNLVELYLNYTDVSDISALQHLKNLEVLELSSTYVSDISALENLTNLESLNLVWTDVSDISVLANLTNLESLELWGTGVSDISALQHLTNLVDLYLSDTDVLDYSVLQNLTNLESLALWETAVSDISVLQHLTNLRDLDLNETAVSDISALQNLTNLEWLDLAFTAVSDYSVLQNLTNLEVLDLGATDVSDYSVLQNLTNLEVLDLAFTAVSDVSPLQNLTNLVDLDLGATDVSDVSPLQNLTNLEWLRLWGTGVSDVSPLQNLTNLETLDLNETAVSDVSPLQNLTNLEWLNLIGCPLSYRAIQWQIPLQLEEVGIDVDFDNVAHPALLKVSGDGQEGAARTALPAPFVVEVMDAEGQPIVGMTVVFEILRGDGSFSALSAATVETDAQGKAQVTYTLGRPTPPPEYGEFGEPMDVESVKASSEGIESWVLFTAVGTGYAPPSVTDVTGDANGDGEVDWEDLVTVAENYGLPNASVEEILDPEADINGDGVVDVFDILVVIVALDAADAAGAPGIESGMSQLQVADVRQWLRDARRANADAVGIVALERLLASLTPTETALLSNYPNPFNPETWIPYQLSEAAAVTVSIYSLDGKRVRTLELGQVPAGVYSDRGRAAYWDGRNAAGEPVASGVYFYTLSAGDFKATRKMVIRK